MAAKVIESPHRILVRNFSVFDLIEKDRKGFMSEQNSLQHINSPSVSAIPFKKDKFNYKSSHFLVNTVESPKDDRLPNTNNGDIFCQELSSFKLDSSLDKSIPENTTKNSKLLL